jgi:DNA-binding PadR family transcriptional regulator
VGEVEKDGERRKLYVLTDLGRAVVDLESARLDALSRMGGRLLKRKGEDNV